ncbi:helix-turn-helix domain-containing protein [Aquimarina sp. W85]|uniref:helix-turn-helix domain-containing protein n=1 Tax=Aquimarina rhodophyticola TaxID=3342246 RepID=UPI00366FD11E
MTYKSSIFAKTLILQSFSILIIMDFGDNMMLLRKKKKLSQAALGKMIDTSGDVVGRYERGDIKPSIDVVVKIADALEISVDYLIGKSKLQLDKQAIERLERISELSEDNKNFLYNMIDMALRDFKTKKAYA